MHASPFPELGNSSTEGFDVKPAVFTRNTKVKASARYESSTADDSDSNKSAFVQQPIFLYSF